MLVDEQNGNVLALRGEAIESGLDGRRLGLCVDNEKVLLAIRRLGDVLCYSLVVHRVAFSQR